jgi:hypothetical protein
VLVVYLWVVVTQAHLQHVRRHWPCRILHGLVKQAEHISQAPKRASCYHVANLEEAGQQHRAISARVGALLCAQMYCINAQVRRHGLQRERAATAYMHGRKMLP